MVWHTNAITISVEVFPCENFTLNVIGTPWNPRACIIHKKLAEMIVRTRQSTNFYCKGCGVDKLCKKSIEPLYKIPCRKYLMKTSTFPKINTEVKAELDKRLHTLQCIVRHTYDVVHKSLLSLIVH